MAGALQLGSSHLFGKPRLLTKLGILIDNEKSARLMKNTLFPILASGLALMPHAMASLVISSLHTTSSIDFTGFTAAGFSPAPSAGQLDSDTWRVAGLSDGNGTFGGTHTTGDFARGANAGTGVTTGGIYAFTVATGNTALGVQPIDADFSPGSITLRIQNTTGSTVSSWNLAYSLFVRNDQDRSSSWNWSWSTNDSTYTQLSSYISNDAADTSPAWNNPLNPSVNALNASVANNDFLYLQWTSDDVAGSGSRDEFAIDNISITAVPEPAAAVIGSLGLLGILRRRR